MNSYGGTFKPIDQLKEQFSKLRAGDFETLAALIGENDKRGQSGYALTEQFFDWFEDRFDGQFTIEGPRRAGRDVELSKVFPDFVGSYPCDFVIRMKDHRSQVLAIGFARYDSTRGGAQSDDRTGGNRYKVEQARQYCKNTGRSFRMLFVADGPGLGHNDTWQEACDIDGDWEGNTRVTTLKLAEVRVTSEWLQGLPEIDAEKSNLSEAINLLSKTVE